MQPNWTEAPLSWGRVHHHKQKLYRPRWRSDLAALVDRIPATEVMLAHGLGRSYGDSCLLASGSLIDCSAVDRIRSFDRETGIIVADAGCSLATLLDIIVPAGWFLPVTPGTKYVTLGGAIANDVHGKNHHTAGTFGRHVVRFNLVRSTGEQMQCSPQENADLFTATIGGLGLTGIIETVALQLKKIASPWMEVDTVPLNSLDDFFRHSDESDAAFEYTVSWIDCLATGSGLGKGLLMRGRHATAEQSPAKGPRRGPIIPFPIAAPNWLLNRHTIAGFNKAYFMAGARKSGLRIEPYDPFFYPLDAVSGWNKMYGRRGFFQLQFVVPSADVIKESLEKVATWGTSSFLVVLKKFSDISSPGLLSFPQPGFTLTLDFANQGENTVKQILQLSDMAMNAGGRIYPAKDAVMTPAMFAAGFPLPAAFAAARDPRMTSDFWQRVTKEPNP